ncbi:Glycosyl hydrolase family 32 domain protein [Cellulomonas flavigena DSM 20109]|uniref:Glycosyl hydrolase family 32 domain protein n=1 Tax=Cellulomonas flavigena (strain ATCC 482 / DSM 20109 / BCRC 11376 / JCM 18109 / NBRC 3775 / NCIMB 8073 / NRS 134) TaxID=446466 RepID=D5UCP3_CELFN|nr:GH32 C-terminal domain-containing protein [Cellulomonas flavigena]ADG76278.1 Glycosyl hydrolase family 32 domain protein [Cellulomonas flavigena DSM 20109]
MRRRIRALGATAAVALMTGLAAPVQGQDAADPHRPVVHFAPQRHWVNDPNGPVWYDGQYHLFFQHNPLGDTWGHMSWGHAVSTDLVTWEERPLAIPWSEREHIFSGTVVVDEGNTSGLGTPGTTPLVAAYTSWDPLTGIQSQSVASSLDAGETWTAYEGNPVLDIGSREFRDPKVFRYEAGGYWVMAVALAEERIIRFYRSHDLIRWTHLSDFGPAGAVGGVWEMPDLFELPVDGDPARTRWVLVVSLNPGAVAGGSGAQYFVGEFDGTRFVADPPPAPGPDGDVLADFEGGTYGEGWTTTGDAFGDGPVSGTLPGQHPVTDFRGEGLVNSFRGGDAATGTLTSPPFTVERRHLTMLVGGGRHPHRPGTGDGAAPAGTVLADFEGTDFGDWTVEGTAFGPGPLAGDAPCQTGVRGYLGTRLANSYQNGRSDPCTPPPDSATGRLVSPTFTVDRPWISMLVGGGAGPGTAVRLVVDGQVVRTASGRESGTLDWATWDVAELAGRRAHLEVVDEVTGGWGHIMVDHIVLSDEPARPRSDEATVNLVVDGRVVRTATGRDSEQLAPVTWDVGDLVGRTAQLVVTDTSTGGWGHILLDHVVATDAPVPTPLERHAWVDHGTDFYAPLTFENTPDGERVAIAWMNNWEYATSTPTTGWRGSMTFPRTLALRTVDGRVVLTFHPVDVPGAEPIRLRDHEGVLDEGTVRVPEATHDGAAIVTVELEVGDAERLGLHVRVGDDERTVVGYDVAAGRMYVDRTRSGTVDFHPGFAGVHTALLPTRDGRVRLQVVVDRSSVEVFGNDGEATITDLVYPGGGSNGVALFAEGGRATVTSLEVRPLGPGTSWAVVARGHAARP